MSRCRVEGTHVTCDTCVLLHDQPGTGNCTWNKAGLVYRATPSDGQLGDNMLGGDGLQQMPETELRAAGSCQSPDRDSGSKIM
jgi:hypothetical protein